MIGKFRFLYPISLNIKTSTTDVTDTAVIELPLMAVLKSTELLSLEKEIKRGDAVTVQLGYNNELNTEFSGFVSNIIAEKTLKVECDNNAFILKNELPNKNFRNTTLKDILSYISTSFNIKLNSEIPEVTFASFLLKDVTGLQAIEKLKSEYGLTAFFDKKGALYVGLAYTYLQPRKIFDLSLNVIPNNSSLKFKKEDEIKFKIKAISILKNNQRLEVETGDNEGEVRTLYFHNITSESELKRLANEEIQKYKYTGYDGSIVTFGLPYVEKGCSIELRDANYPQRQGTYYAESVNVSFGKQGFRRTIELGIKL